jgi:hypothetical protein
MQYIFAKVKNLFPEAFTRVIGDSGLPGPDERVPRDSFCSPGLAVDDFR